MIVIISYILIVLQYILRVVFANTYCSLVVLMWHFWLHAT